MDILYLFDATSKALMLETIMLTVLVSAVACKVRYWPVQLITAEKSDWPRIRVSQYTIVAVDDRRVIGTELVRGAIVTATIIISSFVVAGVVSLAAAYRSISCITLIDWAMNASLAVLLLWASQALVCRCIGAAGVAGKQPTKGVLIHEIVFVAELFLGYTACALPIVQFIMTTLGLSNETAFHLRHIETICVAFLTLPASMAGLAIVLAGTSRKKEFNLLAQSLNDESLATLGGKSHEELHRLIDVAVKLGNLEAADKISRHLLHQAEMDRSPERDQRRSVSKPKSRKEKA